MLQSRIETHVHCRDWEESYKTDISKVTNLARNNGITALIDMPNTKPLIISLEYVEKRLETAELEGCLDGYYLNIGLTNDENQIVEAAKVATKHPRVVGLKYFTTGDRLAIKDEADQAILYEILAGCNYTGNITPHCEKESLFKKGLFNPEIPSTWNDERPKETEEAAVKDQIMYAIEADFRGHIHFPHTSSPGSLDIIEKSMNEVSVSAEVTPQHLLLSTRDMISRKDLDKKLNPPIRKYEDVEKLWKRLRDIVSENKLPITIGTDHAVHTEKEKMEYPYLSGFPGLTLYQNLLREMRIRQFTEMEIKNLTYWNAKKVFPKIKE